MPKDWAQAPSRQGSQAALSDTTIDPGVPIAIIAPNTPKHQDTAMTTASREPTEIITVETTTIPCDGGPNAALGHPRVYLNIETDHRVDCPYCGRRYVLKEGAKPHAGH